MTAGSTIVGMIPIAMEWAVGIERLSPLAVVTIGGLLAGTFLTLLVVPVLFHALESGRRRLDRADGQRRDYKPRGVCVSCASAV